MIEINMIFPIDPEIDIKSLLGRDVQIILSRRLNKFGEHFLVITVDEEELILLKLKFGTKNVWKR